MALRWENLASTTHSLTPRTENRPLFFGILTPCKKPGATGSAGRCERGVGRFTDPHPLTCSFFTPAFFCSMLGLCALPSVLSNQPSEWRKNLFSIEAVPCFYKLPLQALLGLLFLFLLFPSFSQRFLSKWKQCWFSPAWVSPLSQDLPTTGSHASNGIGNPFCWCRSLLGSQSRTQGHTGAFLLSPYSLPTFPLRGKAGLFSKLGCPRFLDSPTTGSHDPNGADSGLLSKLHTGVHRGKFWVHRPFLPFFLSGNPASWRSRW